MAEAKNGPIGSGQEEVSDLISHGKIREALERASMEPLNRKQKEILDALKGRYKFLNHQVMKGLLSKDEELKWRNQIVDHLQNLFKQPNLDLKDLDLLNPKSGRIQNLQPFYLALVIIFVVLAAFGINQLGQPNDSSNPGDVAGNDNPPVVQPVPKDTAKIPETSFQENVQVQDAASRQNETPSQRRPATKQKDTEKERPNVHIETHGPQSPGFYSEGDVSISYPAANLDPTPQEKNQAQDSTKKDSTKN